MHKVGDRFRGRNTGVVVQVIGIEPDGHYKVQVEKNVGQQQHIGTQHGGMALSANEWEKLDEPDLKKPSLFEMGVAAGRSELKKELEDQIKLNTLVWDLFERILNQVTKGKDGEEQ